MNLITHPLRTATVALAAAAALALAGCASEPAETGSPSASTPADEVVSLTDGWVKAAETGMSAAFGVLHNAGETDVTVVSAASDASASLELHETVVNGDGQTVMREVEEFAIPAGGSRALEPGADHIMLMGLDAPLLAGDEVTLTLTFSDGSSRTFTVPVKDFAGANENYESGELGDHSGSGGY